MQHRNTCRKVASHIICASVCLVVSVVCRVSIEHPFLQLMGVHFACEVRESSRHTAGTNGFIRRFCNTCNTCNRRHTRGRARADGCECAAAAGRLDARPPRAARRLLLGAPAHAASGGAAAPLAIIHLQASCSALRQQPAGAGAQETGVAGASCATREKGQRRASVEPVPCVLPGTAC